MKKKTIPILVVIALIVLILGITVIARLVEKYTPSKERMELNQHYNLTQENQAALILNGELFEYENSTICPALYLDGSLYLDYDFVHNYINPRFYWDSNENILFYTTSSDVISANAESTSYFVTKASTEFGKVIVKSYTETAYVNADFVAQYSDMQFSTFDDFETPRAVVRTKFGDVDTITAKKDTCIRTLGGIKSPILADIPKGEKLYLLADLDDWKEVMTESGIIGYTRTKTLGATSTETIASTYTPESFSHIKKDYNINMIWHQVGSSAGNSQISDVLSSTKGVNVVSPTWFYLNDNNGNLYDLASKDYVNYCHNHGVEVWALVSNLENKDVDTSYVLTHSSIRQNLVNQIVSAAIRYNLDGINLDFEALDREEVGDAYIQFVRELSLKCANNGLVLSIDNYAPTDYTAFYNRAEQANFADYVVIMGYDEHYAGSDAGSVASAGWVKEAVANTLKDVPADQIILGMPFYNRIWKLTPASGDDAENEEGAYVEYETTSYTTNMREARDTLDRNGATLVWLEEEGQYYGDFAEGSTTYKIWLEDVSSLESKLNIMKDNALAGGAFWKYGLETSDVWDTIIKYMN